MAKTYTYAIREALPLRWQHVTELWERNTDISEHVTEVPYSHPKLPDNYTELPDGYPKLSYGDTEEWYLNPQHRDNSTEHW